MADRDLRDLYWAKVRGEPTPRPAVNVRPHRAYGDPPVCCPHPASADVHTAYERPVRVDVEVVAVERDDGR